MSRFTLLHALAAWCRVPAVPPGGASPAASIRLGLISEGTNTWPLYAAQALGLFEREGLVVDVRVVGSSVKQQEELKHGGFDVGFQQPDHVVRAVEQGADLFIVAPHGHAPDLTLVGAPDIRTIADLRGRTIAVDGARTGYALLLRRLLRKNGITEADVVFREIGGSQERFDAMKSGQAAASLLNSPFDMNLLAAGYASLARMNEAFPTYPGSVMAARRSWAHAHRRELAAFLRAFGEAYAWLEKPGNAGEALDMLPEHLAIAPRAAAAALDGFAQRPRPQLTADGMRQVIDTVWEAEGYSQPKSGPEKYMDLSFAEGAQ
jgi:ABC-type nitrate/sulfonate/bicarbonate transport system substrate-binding protein